MFRQRQTAKTQTSPWFGPLLFSIPYLLTASGQWRFLSVSVLISLKVLDQVLFVFILFCFVFLTKKCRDLSYFSMKTYVVGTHKKPLSQALLISIHNIFFFFFFFLWRRKKTFFLANLLISINVWIGCWAFTALCICPKDPSLMMPLKCPFTFKILGKKFSRQKYKIFFWIFPENRLCHFMQIVSLGDNLLEMSKPISWKKIREILSVCRLMN